MTDVYEKINAEKELHSALLDFLGAYIKLNNAMSNIYIDANDYIVDEYPFDKSFDELDIYSWIEKSLENF